MQYWLMKSEADCYSIADLEKDKVTPWTEVRNYQARNFLRSMEKGDIVLFYHSNNGDKTGIVGEAVVSKIAYTDPTQFEESGEFFDPRSDPTDPRWSCVDVKYLSTYSKPVYLSDMKQDPDFRAIGVVQKGSRLSVLPILKNHYEKIHKLGRPK